MTIKVHQIPMLKADVKKTMLGIEGVVIEKFVTLGDHEHALAEKESLLEAQRQETYKAVEREHAAKKQIAEQSRELERLQAENSELEQLFDKQWKRTVEAGRLWSEAHNKPLVRPDLGELISWLIKRHDDLLRVAVELADYIQSVQRRSSESSGALYLSSSQ